MRQMWDHVSMYKKIILLKAKLKQYIACPEIEMSGQGHLRNGQEVKKATKWFIMFFDQSVGQELKFVQENH